MPSKNIVKHFVSDTVYHAYNRGANKDLVFKNEVDYRVLLGLFKKKLSPTLSIIDKHTGHTSEVENDEYIGEEVQLLGFCLMPNHYHLIIKQYTESGMTELIRSVFTSYSMYFNKRYGRSGSLFQGVYKATDINNEKHLGYLSAYIHLNPVKDGLVKNPEEWEWSSYDYYLGKKRAEWLSTETFFNLAYTGNSIANYRDALKDYVKKKDDFDILPNAILIEG